MVEAWSRVIDGREHEGSDKVAVAWSRRACVTVFLQLTVVPKTCRA